MKLFKFNKLNKDDYIFLPLVVLLSVLLIITQVKILAADYSNSNLKVLKEEVR